jgi:hypothetical protein
MKYYISLTGLHIKSAIHYPKFIYYAVSSMTQAKSAPANISADAKYVNDIHHTLTVWESRKDMTKFLVSGAHAKAMKVIGDISDANSVYGYESDTIPTWDEAVAILKEKGGGRRRHGVSSSTTTTTSPEKSKTTSNTALESSPPPAVSTNLAADSATAVLVSEMAMAPAMNNDQQINLNGWN